MYKVCTYWGRIRGCAPCDSIAREVESFAEVLENGGVPACSLLTKVGHRLWVDKHRLCMSTLAWRSVRKWTDEGDRVLVFNAVISISPKANVLAMRLFVVFDYFLWLRRSFSVALKSNKSVSTKVGKSLPELQSIADTTNNISFFECCTNKYFTTGTVKELGFIYSHKPSNEYLREKNIRYIGLNCPSLAKKMM